MGSSVSYVPEFILEHSHKILKDPIENVVLHCKVQECLTGQGKWRNNNINSAWKSSEDDWKFVGRGLSVGGAYMWWSNITQGFADNTLILTDFICFSSYCLFKIQCCACTDTFQILCEPPESKAFK